MNQSRFHVAPHIATKRRGERLIIFNPNQINPLYFPDGGSIVLEVMARLRDLGAFENMAESVVSATLLQQFLQHSVVVPEHAAQSVTPRNHSCGSNGCSVKEQPSSQSLYLLLAQYCNQACVYCLNGAESYQSSSSPRMSMEIARKAIVRSLELLAAGGNLNIVLFGGEPLMNWRLGREVIEYAATEAASNYPDKTIRCSVTTNLTVMPKDLIEVAHRRGVGFLVDIDGPEELHDRARPFRSGLGTFRTTSRHIKALRNAGVSVELRATVTALNAERLLDVAATHKELGGSSSAYVPLNVFNSDGTVISEELWPEPAVVANGLRAVFQAGLWPLNKMHPFNVYLSRFTAGHHSPFSCGAPYGNIPVVTANGRVYACIYLVGDNRYLVDQLDTDLPREAANRNLAHMKQKADVELRVPCRTCDVRSLCGGGCPTHLFLSNATDAAHAKAMQYSQTLACTVAQAVLDELLWARAEAVSCTSSVEPSNCLS